MEQAFAFIAERVEGWIWDLDTGSYADVYRVASGTGFYTGASAVIVLSGTLDPKTGKGVSQYRGIVTTSPPR